MFHGPNAVDLQFVGRLARLEAVPMRRVRRESASGGARESARGHDLATFDGTQRGPSLRAGHRRA